MKLFWWRKPKWIDLTDDEISDCFNDDDVEWNMICLLYISDAADE